MEHLAWNVERVRLMVGALIVITGACLALQLGYQWVSGSDPTVAQADAHVRLAALGSPPSSCDTPDRSAGSSCHPGHRRH
jgi:hypothetical protein